MNENMILEEWKKSLEFQNVYFTFFVKSFDEGRLRKVANAFNIGKSTASRIIRRVAQAISKLLATKYVQVHTTEEDVNSLVKNFHAQHGFPQCLGAKDGTSIRRKNHHAVHAVIILTERVTLQLLVKLLKITDIAFSTWL